MSIDTLPLSGLNKIISIILNEKTEKSKTWKHEHNQFFVRSIHSIDSKGIKINLEALFAFLLNQDIQLSKQPQIKLSIRRKWKGRRNITISCENDNANTLTSSYEVDKLRIQLCNSPAWNLSLEFFACLIFYLTKYLRACTYIKEGRLEFQQTSLRLWKLDVGRITSLQI